MVSPLIRSSHNDPAPQCRARRFIGEHQNIGRPIGSCPSGNDGTVCADNVIRAGARPFSLPTALFDISIFRLAISIFCEFSILETLASALRVGRIVRRVLGLARVVLNFRQGHPDSWPDVATTIGQNPSPTRCLRRALLYRTDATLGRFGVRHGLVASSVHEFSYRRRRRQNRCHPFSP
jgi:hypothetical protein